MRWPSVVFMTAHAIAHFIVAYILDVDNLATGWVGFQGFILSALLIFNLSVNLWDTKLRFKELLMKSEQILVLIKRCTQDKYLLKQWKRYNWSSAHAKSLFIPKSPCVHQTLTYRDESCLNLPDYLLVKGDVIHLYPGERAPGDCVRVKAISKADRDRSSNLNDDLLLQEGQIFHPVSSKQHSDKILDIQKIGSASEEMKQSSDEHNTLAQFNHARLKKAARGADFVMLSTPYIRSLRISLQRSHKRPVNSVEKECFIISRKYFETFVIPSVFILSTIVTAIHYGYLDLTDSDQKIKTISIAYLLLRPSLTIMPFLPWMFPCFWMAVNAYGSARILCCGEAQREKSYQKITGDDNHAFTSDLPFRGSNRANTTPLKFENLLATPTAAGSSENKHDEDELQDLRSDIKYITIFKVCIDLIRGKSGHVWRSSSILQVLGCLTSLCCIDKVGILSWSNPIPEKVFILERSLTDEAKPLIQQQRNSSNNVSSQNLAEKSVNHQQQTFTDETGELKNLLTVYQDDQVSNCNINVQSKHQSISLHKPEVLDVSQSVNCFRGSNFDRALSQQHTRLQFDDLNWGKFIGNLKPLGLTIMMNNCCEKSFGDYFRFYKHISYESILRCNITPVVKRRCLCGLSKLIGFSNDVVGQYKYINQIGIYKLIDPSSIKKGRLASSLENTTRLKLPFSNMICNIHQDITTGGYQVFSQGTADIILDACIEFWDGKQIVPLEESTRKKIMDFYHRTSLTSYCSAFAYTPLLKSHDLSSRYIEFPPENSRFTPQIRKLTREDDDEFLRNQLINLPQKSIKSSQAYGSQLSSQDNIQPTSLSDTSNSTSLVPATNLQRKPKELGHITRRYLSAEDLTELIDPKDKDMLNKTTTKKNQNRSNQLNDALDELTDQVFVGMVAMQYQACPDFVALVEQLEHACIRFVHFSKENELRSRVFSEKMGLESGWNCHISLQSNQDIDKSIKCNTAKHVSSHIDKYMNEVTDIGTFSPSTRISNILSGSRYNKSVKDNRGSIDDATSCDQSISSDEHTFNSWRSLPSIVARFTAKLLAVQHQFFTPEHDKTLKNNQPNCHLEMEVGDNLALGSDYGDETSGQEVDNDNAEGLTKDEGFESLAFDMSNRAKLPKGIENIRPHLETVDNVPLQVSLFTDCTPDLTQEMIEIMQDYGEIVCVIGSSSSKLNTPVFLQANASIAIEPLVPQSCTRSGDKLRKMKTKKHRKQIKESHGKHHKKASKSAKIFKNDEEVEYTTIDMKPRLKNPRDRLGIGPVEPSKPLKSKPQIESSSSSSSSSSISSAPTTSQSESEKNDETFSDEEDVMFDEDFNGISESSKKLIQELPGPSALASKLASLPCSYNYNRKDQVYLYSLIMEARHFTFKMKNTFVCMICFALSISSAQFLASILFLPPMLSSGLTIWLTVVVVPLQSFSLMSTTMDSQVMKIAVGKNLQLKPENITFFVICYLIKFIPSIIIVVLSFGLVIAHSCQLTGFGSSSLGPCWMFTYVQHGNATSSEIGDEDLLWSSHLLTAQVSAAFLLVLYFGK